jgi:hypothetical protein
LIFSTLGIIKSYQCSSKKGNQVHEYWNELSLKVDTFSGKGNKICLFFDSSPNVLLIQKKELFQ